MARTNLRVITLAGECRFNELLYGYLARLAGFAKGRQWFAVTVGTDLHIDFQTIIFQPPPASPRARGSEIPCQQPLVVSRLQPVPDHVQTLVDQLLE